MSKAGDSINAMALAFHFQSCGFKGAHGKWNLAAMGGRPSNIDHLKI